MLAPPGSLPQAAERLDNDFSRSFDTEILLDVDSLNLDAASFRQMLEVCGGDAARVSDCVLATVRARGKQHNRVTGSGGMLLGTVVRTGSAVQGRVQVGARVASLVSLTLTPLRLDHVLQVHERAAQMDVRGQAVLFDSAPFAVVPNDLPERVVLAALDVCGAPALVARAAEPGQSVLVLGAGGKSGLLAVSEARRGVGPEGRVVGLESKRETARELVELGLCDEVIEADAQHALSVRALSLAANRGREFDLVVSCVNAEGAEMGAILCTRERGKAVFFAMTTSFSRAALGAEGVGKDIDLVIGNGYAQGHAELSLELLRRDARLRDLFERRYAKL